MTGQHKLINDRSGIDLDLDFVELKDRPTEITLIQM
jgi:hypothetical protein